MISIQPEPEHVRHDPFAPRPLQKTQLTATSTPGSTNGKNVGPKRIFVSGAEEPPRERRERPLEVGERDPLVRPTSPSIWWKTGEWRGSMSSLR